MQISDETMKNESKINIEQSTKRKKIVINEAFAMRRNEDIIKWADERNAKMRENTPLHNDLCRKPITYKNIAAVYVPTQHNGYIMPTYNENKCSEEIRRISIYYCAYFSINLWETNFLLYLVNCIDEIWQNIFKLWSFRIVKSTIGLIN